jgi:cbb3-type cytochrome oxidase maturation protein
MTVVWILLVMSLVVLPGVALLALRWALRHGEFKNVDQAALSIFDEEEPVGELSDRFPIPPARPDKTARTSFANTASRPAAS